MRRLGACFDGFEAPVVLVQAGLMAADLLALFVEHVGERKRPAGVDVIGARETVDGGHEAPDVVLAGHACFQGVMDVAEVGLGLYQRDDDAVDLGVEALFNAVDLGVEAPFNAVDLGVELVVDGFELAVCGGQGVVFGGHGRMVAPGAPGNKGRRAQSEAARRNGFAYGDAGRCQCCGTCGSSESTRSAGSRKGQSREFRNTDTVTLRAGYKTTSAAQRSAALGRALGSSAPGLSEFYGMFMGAGFRSKFGSMDYTLLPYGELGNAHRFSFTVRFGGPQSFPLVEGGGADGGLAAVAP